MYSFEDFYFSSIVWNTYVLYHEFYSLTENLDWDDFCKQLALELWKQCLVAKK